MAAPTAWIDHRLTLGESEARRITGVLGQTLQLVAADEGSISAKELEEGFASVRADLAILEHAYDKAEAMVTMSDQELASYAKMKEGIQATIERTQGDIAKAKTELEAARQIKRNKQEYDMVATHVEVLPARKETQRQIAHVQSELAALESTRRACDEKLELRRKQFALLMHAAHDLEQTLAADDNEASSSLPAAASPAAMDTKPDHPGEAPPSA